MNWLIIMAGGNGERFWPMSRRQRPKQLLPIISQETMIQETMRRLRPLFEPRRVIVVTNRDQAAEVRRQLPKSISVIAEPMGRNTAPCIGLAAAVVAQRDPHGVMAVVPADSYIGNVPRYRRAVKDSLTYARTHDVLITVGIQPLSPQTGYGYVQVGQKLTARFSKAKRFVEKPDLATARKYLAAGTYRWNAGMFVWSVAAVQAAFAKFQPRTAAACQRLQRAVDTPAFARVLAREYPRLKKISVDYAIMERADNVLVAHGDFPWDDVGDFAALERHFPPDPSGNHVRGQFIGLDASDCVVFGPRDHLIAAIGVAGLVIVHTADATLVCRKADAQRVKQLVQKLGARRALRHLL